MRRVLAAALAAAALAGCALRSSTAGSPAPAFRFKTLEGGRVTLDDCRGRVCLLTIWATWCPSCREEIPVLNALNRKYGAKLLVLGVSVDKDPEDLQRFLREQKLEYPVARGDDTTLAAFGWSGVLPTTILVGPSGRVRVRYTGPRSEPILSREVERLLAEGRG